MNAIPVLNLNNVLVEEGTSKNDKTYYVLASNIVEINGQRFKAYSTPDHRIKLYPIVESAVVNKTEEVRKQLSGNSIGTAPTAPKTFTTKGKKTTTAPTVNPVLKALAEKMGLDIEMAAAAFPHLAK